MNDSFSPHLCGGILFDLLLEARKIRTKTRDKYNGGTDGLSEVDLYSGLVNVVTGEDISRYSGATIKKAVSDYKTCVSSKGSYVPFTEQGTVVVFNNMVENQYSILLKRVTKFIDQFLSAEKTAWLVCALVDTIVQDITIPDTEEFYVDYESTIKAKRLGNSSNIFLQPFLISVLRYVLNNCPDCESGRDTFLKWYSQTSTKSRWKFCSDIGTGDSRICVLITREEEIDRKIEQLSPRIPDDGGLYSVRFLATKPLIPTEPVRFDSNTRVIYLQSEEISLPLQLVPHSEISKNELPYVNALCDVYAEKLERTIMDVKPDSIPSKFQNHFAEQRKAFYSAESVRHAIREVFEDGEKQFDILEKDAYDGIEPTYHADRYLNGYERLQAVLEKITSTTLSKSTMDNIRGLIGNLEKKGLCHILVNDEIIKSWVTADE